VLFFTYIAFICCLGDVNCARAHTHTHTHTHTYIYIYYRCSALWPVWAETRAQSGDWYGSGTLHPGKILRSSLPLLSPAFRRSHFRPQVSPRPPRREISQRRKVELWARLLSGNFTEMTTSTPFRDLLHAANL
jgi:hypothetical protein